MEAIIFIGIPGSGKTTFFLERFFRTHVRISKDLLRTRNREQVFLRACLATQQRFVIDNTNVVAAERALYIPQAKAARYRLLGYVFETALEDAILGSQASAHSWESNVEAVRSPLGKVAG